jgi:predicted SAM-dependent methyltransferase
MTDMSECIPDHSVDAIWSSHSIEHLHAYEVPVAFKEFSRVLALDGFLLINCPDMEQIAERILETEIDRPAYTSPAGPITPLDMIFGHQKSIRAGNHFMSHRTGFTQKLLATRLLRAGFAEVRVRRGNNFDLWSLAIMPETDVGETVAMMKDAGLDFEESPTE